MPGAAAAALLSCALTLALGAPAQAAARAESSPAQGAADAAARQGACPDYEFIGARGSGEDNGVPAKSRYTPADPTLGMGGPVSDLFKRVSRTAAANDVTIAPYAVPYPAVGIDVVGSDALVTGGGLGVYSKSVELGAHAAAAELERVSRDCPGTGVVMSGYSQGAQVIVQAALSATPGARSSIVAAVFFGNTFFTSDEPGNDFGSFLPGLDGYLASTDARKTVGDPPGSSSNAAAARGAAGADDADSSSGPDGGDWVDKFDGAPIFDYCHDGDPICGLVAERTVDGTRYPVRDFAHIVASDADEAGSPSILTHHTDYQRGDTANAAQHLRFVLGLPLRAAGLPGAEITAPQTAVAGVETQLNAGGSLSDPRDPIIAYRWTIDPGTADARMLTTSQPILTTSFRDAGAHTVSLQTTTVSGAQAEASAALTVVAAPSAAPRTPHGIAATAGDGAVSLSWPAVPGAQFYAVRDASGRLLTAFTPLVAGQQQVSWTDSGLRNGSKRGYRVYAVNSMGASRGSKLVTVTPEAASAQPALATVHLPRPATTLVEPELVWALGLGLIAATLVLALIRTAAPRRRPPRRLRR
jgi:hypothetical protein